MIQRQSDNFLERVFEHLERRLVDHADTPIRIGHDEAGEHRFEDVFQVVAVPSQFLLEQVLVFH